MFSLFLPTFLALFLSAFSPSSSIFLLLPLLSHFLCYLFLTSIFFLRMYSCIYRSKTFSRRLFHRTQEYTRQSEVFIVSL
jgi:hypothetical protein